MLHLTFAGREKTPATVDFAPGLTVIYGASDTGKSFIVDALDYMFGGTKLREIPEGRGYTQILLGLEASDGQVLTLQRSTENNKVAVFRRDLRNATSETPDKYFSVTHKANSRNNLSRFLLDILGLDGKWVRKNAKGEARTFSLRDVAHLSLINETRMMARQPPVLSSGQKIHETVEKSIFKLLLTGEGDSNQQAKSTVEEKVSEGRAELLDQLILDLKEKLDAQSSETQLRDQLDRLNASLTAESAAIGGLATERANLTVQHRALGASVADTRQRASEVQALLERFGLLRQQYESDLERLEMVSEAGTLLGYFRSGPCAFCGADLEHQAPDHQLEETTQLHLAVVAEKTKTTELHADLLDTIGDLEQQSQAVNAAEHSIRSRLEAMAAQISRLDERLAPLHSNLQELAQVRSSVERELSIHGQIQDLHDFGAGIAIEESVPVAITQAGLPARTIADFESVLQHTLGSWEVPSAGSVTYDQSTGDFSVGGRWRSDRGKGIRGVLHAAFSTALTQYCAERELSHSGFLVLDSPVITYRQPDDGDDLVLTPRVVEHFYSYLLNEFPVQAIVIENGDPPEAIRTGALTHYFSGSAEGRFGLFPVSGAG
ncbi:AAA family ATPase [Actinoallomurus bryophytorum]|uniref:AAA family ATPase n=1 Tax=Actinoallomurus bryophytorum TaxID=1490222 RepID=UPI00163A1C52|nr:AAA family ATPase [Actinoallomurus bryophytorum]